MAQTKHVKKTARDSTSSTASSTQFKGKKKSSRYLGRRHKLSAWQKFQSETMQQLKMDKPDMTAQERREEVSRLWAEHKGE